MIDGLSHYANFKSLSNVVVKFIQTLQNSYRPVHVFIGLVGLSDKSLQVFVQISVAR